MSGVVGKEQNLSCEKASPKNDSVEAEIRVIFNKFRKEYAVPHSLIVDDMESDVLGVVRQQEATRNKQLQDFPCLKCYEIRAGKCRQTKHYTCAHEEYWKWFEKALLGEGSEGAEKP